MANEEHVNILKQGVAAWNKWRKENPDVKPDLSNAEGLKAANLRKADFALANLQGAELSGADLYGAILVGANLDRAILMGAHLQEAVLTGATLRHAYLKNVNLRDADLFTADLALANLEAVTFDGADINGANLRDANLRNANLANVKSLKSEQLAGADLTGAKLPEAVAEFDALKVVAELTTITRKIFIGVMGACFYCLLTAGTTTAVGFLDNTESPSLPIIQAQIPLVYFYIFAPILLLAVYVYLHVYLQRLWEEFSKLPAVFEDGTPLDRKSSPWMVSNAVRPYVLNVDAARPRLARLESALITILVWYLLLIRFVQQTPICCDYRPWFATSRAPRMRR